MTFTYKTYLLTADLDKYSDDIVIIEKQEMDLGAIVTFQCENSKVLDEIFSEN